MQKSFFYVLFRHFFARFVFFLRNLVKEQSKCPLLHVTEMLLIVQIYFFRHVIKMAGDRERGLPAKVGIWIHNIFFIFRSFLVLLLLPHLECGSMPGMRIVLNILLFYPPSFFKEIVWSSQPTRRAGRRPAENIINKPQALSQVKIVLTGTAHCTKGN